MKNIIRLLFLLVVFSSSTVFAQEGKEAYQEKLQKEVYIDTPIDSKWDISTPFDTEIISTELHADFGDQEWVIYTPEYDSAYRWFVKKARFVGTTMKQLEYIEEIRAEKISQGQTADILFFNLHVDFFDEAGNLLAPPSKQKLEVVVYFRG